MMKEYKKPKMEVVKMPDLPMLQSGISSFLPGPSESPSLDDPESMFPYVILGKE